MQKENLFQPLGLGVGGDNGDGCASPGLSDGFELWYLEPHKAE